MDNDINYEGFRESERCRGGKSDIEKIEYRKRSRDMDIEKQIKREDKR